MRTEPGLKGCDSWLEGWRGPKVRKAVSGNRRNKVTDAQVTLEGS